MNGSKGPPAPKGLDLLYGANGFPGCPGWKLGLAELKGEDWGL